MTTTQTAPDITIMFEQHTLGAMMVDVHGLKRIGDLLQPSDFVMEQHRVIFEAMLKLRNAGKPTDIALVVGALGGTLEQAGGLSYLAALPIETPSALNLAYYATEVLEASRRRMVTAAGERLASATGDDVEGLIGQAETMLKDVRGRQQQEEWQDKADFIQELIDELTGPMPQSESGLLTGIGPLDSVLRGIKRKSLVIVGARPGVGKTSLSTTVLYHAAKAGRHSAFFSLEMDRRDIYGKLWTMATGIPHERLTSYHLTDEEKKRLRDSGAWTHRALVDVIPANEWSIQDIRRTARAIHSRRPLDLIVVDYLQFIEPVRSDRKENRVQEVSSDSKNLKQMAQELDCVVLVPTQLNRAPQGRADHEPQLSDLRESGTIEQDADIGILLWEPPGVDPENRPDVSEVFCKIAKNRRGKKGRVTLGFHGPMTEFVALEKREVESPPSPKRGREAAYRDDDEGMTV